MKNENYLSVWIKRFLLEYIISTRNLSKNTQRSYRDTLRLMLPFIAQTVQKPIEKMLINDVSAEIIKAFLLNLEINRGCSIATRNQRLAAIQALAKFIGMNNPEYIEWCRLIQMIPLKRMTRTLITYLEKAEMDALLNAPDQTTKQGKRDYALLLFLYNTGSRADEAAQLTIADLDIAHVPNRDFSIVTIKGKGNKLRRCPLWQQTVTEIKGLIANRGQTEHVFINRCQDPLTRFGIHAMVKRYAKAITPQFPSIEKKRVSPHTIRHTTATHLLRSGVDINTIRAWLGHVSINTTNIYAEVDLEMKAKALACCEIIDEKPTKKWKDDKEIMEFLNTL